jgi:integrase
MNKRRLTAAAVAKMKEPGEHADGTVPGLYLEIRPTTSSKAWSFRYRRPGSGKPARITLGSVNISGKVVIDDKTGKPDAPRIGGHLTLADAHVLAAQQRNKLAAGIDPGREHQAEKQRQEENERAALAAAKVTDETSFPAMARLYVKRHAKPNLRRWKFMARRLGLDPEDDALPVIEGSIADRWRERPAAAIKRTDVVAEVDRAVDKGRPTAGNHLLAALRTMFRWHQRRGSLEGNPCAMVGMPVGMLKLRRSRKLSDDEIRWLWRALDDSPPAFASFVRFLTLTAVRRDEARLMVRGELSVDGKTWTVPVVRAKNHLEHLVPLSEQARKVLADAPRIEGKAGYIFSTNGEAAIGAMSWFKRRLDTRMTEIAGAPVPPWRFHDLRRTARSWLSRVTTPDIAERVLGHVVGGVRAVYDLHEFRDEKERALRRWGAEVERIVAGRSAKIVPIGRARS